MPPLHTKLKPVDVQQHWLRQLVQRETDRILIKLVSTNDMPADGLTKPLSPPKFDRFLELSGLSDAVLTSQRHNDTVNEDSGSD